MINVDTRDLKATMIDCLECDSDLDYLLKSEIAASRIDMESDSEELMLEFKPSAINAIVGEL